MPEILNQIHQDIAYSTIFKDHVVVIFVPFFHLTRLSGRQRGIVMFIKLPALLITWNTHLRKGVSLMRLNIQTTILNEV